MISLFSGTPGAGKSLHLASILYNRMRFFKRPIVGNFNCDFSKIKNPKGTYVYPEAECPDCGVKMQEKEIESTLTLLFTRAQLARIKSL